MMTMSTVGEFFLGNTSVQRALVGMAVPWMFLLAYVAYSLLRRPREYSPTVIAPFTVFMSYLTDGATAGYDRQLMTLFHPKLLDNMIERGLLRAMVRCLCKRLGKVTCIPRDTAMLRSKDNDVNFVALVDFEHARQVQCRMSWTWRGAGCTFPTPAGCIRPFYVTGFCVEPRREDQFDVLEFLHTDDFVAFAESFVERLFERPPRAAVAMMVPALQEKYSDDLEKLQRSIERLCGTALATCREVNVTLMSEEILRAPAACTEASLSNDKDGAGKDGSAHEEEKDKGAVRGIEMHFLVNGIGHREIEATVVLTFSGLRCHVMRYELRTRPDTRTQVLLDHDTGEKTIVG